MHRSQKVRIAVVAVTAGSLFTAAPAFARGGGGVQRSGHCSAASTWKLQAKPDGGRLEVEFQVDSNVAGQKWAVRLSDNGTVFLSGIRTTHAPSGSFDVRTLTANRAGADNIAGKATNAVTGESCFGTVRI